MFELQAYQLQLPEHDFVYAKMSYLVVLVTVCSEIKESMRSLCICHNVMQQRSDHNRAIIYAMDDLLLDSYVSVYLQITLVGCFVVL